MRLYGWSALAAGLAAAGAIAAGTAAPAVAGSPIGTVVADGVRDAPVTDERGRLVFMASPGTVRIVDPAAPADVRDVPVDCLPDERTAGVLAAAEGFALLTCLRPEGFDGRDVQVPLVADLATGSLARIPVMTEQGGWNVTYVGIGASGLCFNASAYKNGSWAGRIDWRTGVVTRGQAACPGRLADRSETRLAVTVPVAGGRRLVLSPAQPENAIHPFSVWDADTVVWALRTIAPRMPVNAYLRGCGVRLRWETSPLTQALLLRSGLVLAEATRGRGPVTVLRVPLDGACERATSAWRGTLTSAGRRVALAPRSAAGSDATTGAATALIAPQSRVPVVRRLGERSALRLQRPARLVRFRVGDGRWRSAQGSGRTWTLPGTQPARRRTTLHVDARLRDGGRAGYEVRVR